MGVLLLDDVHGLCVFPEDMPVQFVSVSGSVVVGPSAAIFIEEFGKAYKMFLNSLTSNRLHLSYIAPRNLSHH